MVLVSNLKGVIVLLCVLLLVGMVNGFEADVSPESVSIPIDSFAKFNVTIKNSEDFQDVFRIFFLHYPEWEIKTDPLENPILMELGPGEEGVREIIIKPLHVAGVGTYLLDVKIESRESDALASYRTKISLFEPLKPGVTIPIVTAEITAPDVANPGKVFEFEVDLRNQNIVKHENLELVVRSVNGLFNKNFNITLESKERSVKKFEIGIDKNAIPQSDAISVEIMHQGETILSGVQRPYKINAYSEIDKSEKESSFFLKSGRNVSFSNKGNVVYDGPVTVSYSLFNRMFISTDPKGEFLSEEDGRLIQWNILLQPGETMTIHIVTNFRILLYILILIFIVLLIYVHLRSPIIVEKKVTHVDRKEGGISEIKVMITLKNRGKKAVKTINVTDKVTQIGHVKKGVDIGTLQPSKVLTHEHKGTLLKWDVNQVDAGEERVMAYRITASLPITGGVELPSAMARFHLGRRKVKSKSNSINID
ncbi:hypothetical protein ACFLZX_03975 [Nanoarchaeota archaeon]